MKVRALRALSFVTVAAFAAACNDSTAPDRQPADLGEVLTEMTVPSIAATLVPGLPATPSTSAPTPSSCSYDAATQSFTCPTVTATGVSFTRSFTLLTLAGTPQSQFDAATTDAVRTNSTMAGTFTTSGSTFTVAGQEELTLSGLLSGVHTLAGTSLLNVTGTEAASGAPYTLSITTHVNDLVLPATRADKWPKSGSIVVDLTHTVSSTTSTSHLSATFTARAR